MTALEGIVTTIVGGIIGVFFWMFKRTYNRIDHLDDRLDKALSEPQIRQIIDDKIEPLRAQHTDFAHRLGRLEGKIDKLIELVMRDLNKK